VAVVLRAGPDHVLLDHGLCVFHARRDNNLGDVVGIEESAALGIRVGCLH